MSHLDQFIAKCHNRLIQDKDDDIEAARQYLDSRHVSNESIVRHKIGYCSRKELIPPEIAFYGKDVNDLQSDDRGHAFFIKNRLVVPVYSEFGTSVGFATRKPSSDPGNTWWNLPKPFHKGTHLFLLNLCRQEIFKKNKIYLVEGYFDGILLMQEGLKAVAGLMGTAFSPRKIGLIARYCNNICLCLDADVNQSGQKAQEKAIFALKEFGFCESISVIELPLGTDPDVYVREHGLQDFLSKERQLKSSEISSICKKIRKWNH